VTRGRLALAAGLAAAVLVSVCAGMAWRAHSPLVPREGGTADDGTAWTFLALLVAAFALYVVALGLIRAGVARPAVIVAVALAIQLAPLAAPLLLSTDAWTYWDYGRIAAVHGGNPYADPPSAYPADPAYREMGANWRGKTSVYGPAFTLTSEPLARVVGRSSGRAAWSYKVPAALAVLAATLLAARLARRRSLAAAFVGWNPVLAIHLAGGGHNDAWVGALVLGALSLAAARRVNLAGALWVLAIAVKWVPLVFLALHAVAVHRRRERIGAAGACVAAALVAALGSWRYGWHWVAALAPLADNARLETSYAIPHRLQEAGVPREIALGLAIAALAAGLAWLGFQALRGRARLALAACLVLVTTPYLVVWYLGWAVPLAGADDDDRLARACTLLLCAYLLPQTIPL